ncbi:MAG: hypothetical protein H6739_20685 [Alphaproteobacteria bacterium]|nr:hypothetical protein [Alphaproteobacteria bacterium]
MALSSPCSVYLLALLGTLAATPAFAGISVGHPSVTLASADTSDVKEVFLPLDEIRLVSPTSQTHTIQVDDTLDLIAGEDVTLPVGTWDEMTLYLSGDVEITLISPTEQEVDYTLTLGQLPVDLGDGLEVNTSGAAMMVLVLDAEVLEDAAALSDADPCAAEALLEDALLVDIKLIPE